jgi:chromosome segregation ATPase
VEDVGAEFTEADVNKEVMESAVLELQRENQELQDKLTIAMAASSDDLDREMAESVIKDLRAQIRALEIELKEVKISRDTYLRENSELKKQITSLLKKLKKLEG